jgi:hypothetical protein
VRSILQDCEQCGYRYLVVLVEKALKKAPDDLEQDSEENEDKASDTKKEELLKKSGNHGSAEEKKMYDPLVCNIYSHFLLSL